MTSKELVVAFKIPAEWEADVKEQLRQVEFFHRTRGVKTRRQAMPEVRRAMKLAAEIELDWLVWELEQGIDAHGRDNDTTILMPASVTDDTVISERDEKWPLLRATTD